MTEEQELLRDIRLVQKKPKQKGIRTKGIKKMTHDVFDPLWKSGSLSRDEAYVLMMQVLKIRRCEDAHVSKLSEQQCRQLVNVIHEKRYDIPQAKRAWIKGLQFDTRITKGSIRFPEPKRFAELRAQMLRFASWISKQLSAK